MCVKKEITTSSQAPVSFFLVWDDRFQPIYELSLLNIFSLSKRDLIV
jgi:hypothetical protein